MRTKRTTIVNLCAQLKKLIRILLGLNYNANEYKVFLAILLILFAYSNTGYSQNRPSTLKKTVDAPTKQKRKIIGKRAPGLHLVTLDTTKLSISFPIVPVEITAFGISAKDVKLDVLKVVSKTNSIIPLKCSITPQNSDIYPLQTGKVFLIGFDTLELKSIEPGLYSIFLSVVYEKHRPVIMQVYFELDKTKKTLSFISRFFKGLKDNIISVVWTFIEIIFFIVIILTMIWLIRMASKGRNSLSVLSIVNETGISGEMDGVASGIDDILLTCLQNIREKSNEAQVKQIWLTDTTTSKDNRSVKKAGDTQMSSVTGGGVPVDLHKLGDISIGPVKIPIGTIVSYVTKLFGGNYVTGALQQYGPVNKIVLKLEKRPIFYKQKAQVRFFEVTWPSETIKITDLAEGVPHAIEELGYLITLDITEDIGTTNWITYKNFLDGVICFKEYEDNNTRKDRLLDAIHYWRECIRQDSYFAKGHYNLGVALDLLKEYEDALFRYQKAINLNENLIGVEAHYNLAKLYRDIYKDDVKTIEELEKAERLNPDLPFIYNLKGLVYQGKKDNETAVKLYKKAIDLVKGEANPLFYFNQSVAYYNLKNYNAAKTAGENVLRILKHKVDKQADVLQTMGLIYLKQREFSKALPFFEKGLQLEPENYDMLHGYSIALREVGELDKAIIMHRRAIRIWPGYTNGYIEFVTTLKQSGKYKKESEIYTKIIALFQSDEFLNAWKREDKVLLMQAFDDSIAKNEKDLECLAIFVCVLGSILFYDVKDFNNSDKYFSMAFPDKNLEVEINYLTRIDYLHTYGQTLEKYAQTVTNEERGHVYELAIDKLHQASILYDEEQTYSLAKCFDDLAEVYKKANDYELADKSFIRSATYFKKLNLYIQASDEHVKSAECLMDWSRLKGNFTSYNEALDECNIALSIDSGNYNAFHIKGLNYYHLNKYKLAIPQFEKATEINFSLLGAQYNLGLCYRYLGNFEMAASKFKTIIRLEKNKQGMDPDYILDPYEQLVICNNELGKLDDSEKVLKEAVDLMPSRVRCILLYADVLLKQKLYKQAARYYDLAISQDPDNFQNLRHKSLNSLADLYAEQGIMINKAYSMAREALSICKSRATNSKSEKEYLSMIRGTLGWIFYQQGSYAKAALFLENSIIHQLDDIRLYAHLAMTYQKMIEGIKEKERNEYVEKVKRLWEQVKKLDVNKEWEEIALEQLKLLGE